MKTIRDAVHGDMRFDEAEMAVIDTAPVQRLRGIKQLGTSNLVFPSAGHSRFEHSLGTCWITKRMLASLERSGESITPLDRRTASLAALLHDVTHVPFGHTFEDERRLFPRHDQDRARMEHFLGMPDLARALAQSGAGERVCSVLLDKGEGTVNPPFVRDLVSGTVCADLLDYLKRDALHCGLALDYDERLYHYFGLADGRLVVRLHKEGSFRRDALTELVHLLQIRYSLTERVYYHHAKIVAGAMVSRALEMVLESGAFDRAELYALRDDSFLARLEQLRDAVPGLGDVLDDLATRRLYRRVYLLTLAGLGREGLSGPERDRLAERFHSDTAGRRRVERQIAAELGIPEAHVLIYCPAPDMALKEADVPVEVAPGEVRPLAELGHPDVSALREKHRGLWRFYVCLRRDHASLAARAGAVAANAIGHPNQFERHQRGELTFS